MKMAARSTSPAPVKESEIALFKMPETFRTDEWYDLESFDHVAGTSCVVTDKTTLTGIPFVVSRVTYRETKRRNPAGTLLYYVSLEAQIAPADVLDRWGVSIPSSAQFSAADTVIINDGSTGIYRQMTYYLHHRFPDQIDVSMLEETASDLKFQEAGGKGGSSPFDRPPTMWTNGMDAALAGIPVRVLCKRGLRASYYDNESGDAVTFFLA